MERKSLPAYKSVFELLQNLCPNFQPEKIVTDWEYAQQKAWQETFPSESSSDVADKHEAITLYFVVTRPLFFQMPKFKDVCGISVEPS